jgi:hypothetical protein
MSLFCFPCLFNFKQLLYVLRLLEELDKNTLVLDDGLPLPPSTSFISIPGVKVNSCVVTVLEDFLPKFQLQAQLLTNPDESETELPPPFFSVSAGSISVLDMKRKRTSSKKAIIEGVLLPHATGYFAILMITYAQYACN